MMQRASSVSGSQVSEQAAAKQRRTRRIGLGVVGLVSVILVVGFWRRNANRRYRPSTPALSYAQSATALAKAGNVTQAVVGFNRGIALAPADPAPYIGLAVLYESMDRPDLAIETLEQLEAINPNAKNLRCRLAEAHLGAEDLKGARAYGEKAVVEEPNDARAHSVYGLTMLRFRYWDTAISELQVAMRLAPDDDEIGKVLTDSYLQKGDYPQAIALAERLLAKAPDSARLHYKLGWAYGRQPRAGDSLEQAVAHLQKAGELAPGWLEPFAELGRVYVSLGRKKEAEVAFARAWQLNQSVAGVAFNLANLWRQHGDPRSAAMQKRFQALMREKERFTALRRDFNTEAIRADNTLHLAAAEGKAGMHGVALYRLHRLLAAEPANLDALRLYVRLDREIRARYRDYLRPGPGIGPPDSLQ